MEENVPLKINLLEAKAIKPSHEIQNHKSKKAGKFNFVHIAQNTNLWETSFGKNSIPNREYATLLFVICSEINERVIISKYMGTNNLICSVSCVKISKG